MSGTRPDSYFLLPTGWPRRVPSVVVHAISLTHVLLTVARGRVSEGCPYQKLDPAGSGPSSQPDQQVGTEKRGPGSQFR